MTQEITVDQRDDLNRLKGQLEAMLQSAALGGLDHMDWPLITEYATVLEEKFEAYSSIVDAILEPVSVIKAA
jgi:hypothetical protein